VDRSWDGVQAVAALEEPNRRRLYEYVAGRSEPVSRDEAATALELPRTTAAFHLDKLTDEGLLESCYERRSGRTGPGAGRPAKLYRRSGREIEVSLPERQYAVAGRLLAAAIAEAESTGTSPRQAVHRRAREYGEALGRTAGDAALTEILAAHGFEPRPDKEGIALANCPFQRIAREQPELVCGMNLHLLAGLVSTLDIPYEARLAPAAGYCCVRLVPSGLSSERG
jgi:predicted ArsR family transcriptional regulator